MKDNFKRKEINGLWVTCKLFRELAVGRRQRTRFGGCTARNSVPAVSLAGPLRTLVLLLGIAIAASTA